jgi:hypothetical protein
MSNEPLFVFNKVEGSKDRSSLISRPAILENVSGEMKGARRFAFAVVEAPNDQLFINHEKGATFFDLDKKTPLYVDEIDQKAFFMSRGVLYVIREMSEEENRMFKSYDGF